MRASILADATIEVRAEMAIKKAVSNQHLNCRLLNSSVTIFRFLLGLAIFDSLDNLELILSAIS